MLIYNHLETIAICYIFFAIVAAIFVIDKVARTKKISIMSMCNVMYLLILCVVPAIILFGYTNDLRNTSGIIFSKNTVWTFYLQLVLTVIGYLFLQLGYMIKQRESKPYAELPKQKNLFISVLFTLISAISLVLWASGYGGVSELVANAARIRAGMLSSTNAFAFFKHFVPLSLLSSWMLFSVLLRKEVKGFLRTLGILLCFICNIALSSIYLQANDGRLLVAAYVLLFFIIFFKYQYEVKKANMAPMLVKFGIVFVFAVVILFNADTILRLMRNESNVVVNDDSSLINTIMREFTFIIAGAQTALLRYESAEGDLMIVNDIVNGLFAWLPTSLKPIRLEDVWDYNTKLIISDSYGQSPTSIVAQSVYDLGLLGVIIIPFLYGLFIRKVENILEKRRGIVFYDTIYVALGYYLSKGLPYFSLYNIMLNIFFIFVALIIYGVVQKIEIR